VVLADEEAEVVLVVLVLGSMACGTGIADGMTTADAWEVMALAAGVDDGVV